MTESMTIHLIDGTYELFRCFFGAPPARSPTGAEVGATRGLLRSLNALLNTGDITHVAVAFDTVIESFRNDLFTGYKTGDGIAPDLRAQFPLAEEGVQALGVKVWSMIDFEADDAIATAAAQLATRKDVEKVILCSPDKDLAQCVQGDRVVLWDRRQNLVYDELAVKKKWGVSPASIPDFLALVGDSADGIPGIPRWGMKSAATVLAHYVHIDGIPDDPADWEPKVRGAAGLAVQLNKRRQDAELYRTLATLRLDVPLDPEPSSLRWRGANQKALSEFCEKIGETDLMHRVRMV